MTDIDLDRYGVWVAIAVLSVVTFLIRAGGFWLMEHIPLTPRLRRMLEALPGAVVVATVLPIVVRGGLASGIAIAGAVLIMALRRNDLLAVFCGLAIVAALRAVL
ncbi:MAG: AzlD family protein [Pseudolabrys sp.]